MATIEKMMAPIEPDVMQPGSVMLYQNRRSQRLAAVRKSPKEQRRNVAKRTLPEIAGRHAKRRNHSSSCRSMDSWASFISSSMNMYYITYFLFQLITFFLIFFHVLIPFYHFHFRMPKDPSFQRISDRKISVDRTENGQTEI